MVAIGVAQDALIVVVVAELFNDCFLQAEMGIDGVAHRVGYFHPSAALALVYKALAVQGAVGYVGTRDAAALEN